MHDTIIKTKDGKIFIGPIWKWDPIKGFLSLIGNDEKFYFKDLVSVVTKNERVGVNKIRDVDELARAREWLKSARKFGWSDVPPDFPKQEWEEGQ